MRLITRGQSGNRHNSPDLIFVEELLCSRISCIRLTLFFPDNMTVSNIKTPAQQLFDYLLSHNKVYGMEVFHMVPVTYDFDYDCDQNRAQVIRRNSLSFVYCSFIPNLTQLFRRTSLF